MCPDSRGGLACFWRFDAEIILHDAAMTHFSQWWRRMMRSGYAFAQGAHLHGASPGRHWVWESRRAWIWGFWLPLVCLLANYPFGRWGLIAWLIYPLQFFRQMIRNRGLCAGARNWRSSKYLTRFAEARGQVKFLFDRVSRREPCLIEYK